MFDKRLIDFTMKAKLLEDYLNSDEITLVSDEEFILLESLHNCTVAYCNILKKKARENNNTIIPLGDKSHG